MYENLSPLYRARKQTDCNGNDEIVLENGRRASPQPPAVGFEGFLDNCAAALKWCCLCLVRRRHSVASSDSLSAVSNGVAGGKPATASTGISTTPAKNGWVSGAVDDEEISKAQNSPQHEQSQTVAPNQTSEEPSSEAPKEQEEPVRSRPPSSRPQTAISSEAIDPQPQTPASPAPEPTPEQPAAPVSETAPAPEGYESEASASPPPTAGKENKAEESDDSTATRIIAHSALFERNGVSLQRPQTTGPLSLSARHDNELRIIARPSTAHFGDGGPRPDLRLMLEIEPRPERLIVTTPDTLADNSSVVESPAPDPEPPQSVETPDSADTVVEPTAPEEPPKRIAAKPPIKRKRISPTKATQSRRRPDNMFPDQTRRFERPRDAALACVLQLQSPDWEDVMEGLAAFVRLMRHHPEVVDANAHLLAIELGKQIRNLRSQVARAACQAANEFFLRHRKSSEQDAEELAFVLLHRTADTNKFLRADAMTAVESMCDHLPPAKAIHILCFRGATHQNALVRTTTARMLNRVVERIGGAEPVFALGKDTRDKLILTTANLLMEGSLETRNHAKEVFRQLSAHPGFAKKLLDVIPPRVYRNIEKPLRSILGNGSGGR